MPELDLYVKKTKQEWYTAAICFSSRDGVNIKGNWFVDDYEFPTIALVKCNPNERQCETEANITSFLKNNPFFFIYQEMVVQTEIHEDSEYV